MRRRCPLASSKDTSASPTPSLGDGRCRIEPRAGAEGLGRRPHRLLVPRGEGAQGVLDPVAELAEHRLGDVERVLGDEIDPHPLGADQPHHLLDLLQQRLRRVVEEQVRLVEEEDQLRLLRVADLGQAFEQLGQQPEQEGGVELAATASAGRRRGC